MGEEPDSQPQPGGELKGNPNQGGPKETLTPISRKRSHIEGDEVPQIYNLPKTAHISDFVWPIANINQSEYSKRFNVHIIDTMSMVQQAMTQIEA